jgi:hypothetical protein
MTEPKTPISERHLPRLIVRYIALVVTATALITAVAAIRSSENLKDNLISACQDSRGPLQIYFDKQLANSEQFTVAETVELFPPPPGSSITEEELTESIKSSRHNLRTLLDTYDPAKCEGLYE